MNAFLPIFQLVPKDGFRKLAVHGVPCMCHTDGWLLSSEELYTKLHFNNPHLQLWQMINWPS